MGTENATPGLYSARPKIKVDGQEQAALADGLLNLLIEETVEGLYRCEMTLGNWGTNSSGGVGFLYFDRALLDFGKPLEVALGAADAGATVFKGRVMGLEGRYPAGRSPEISVLAEDRLQDLRMTRRTQMYEEMSDSDIASQIASRHGLRASVDVSGPTHKAIAQVNQSDLAFLRERARAIDAELWVDGDELHLQSHSSRRSEPVALSYGRRLQEFAVLADLAGQRTSLAVTGWDVSAKEGITYAADESAVQPELEGQTGGGAALRQALGERKDQIAHAVPFTDAEAQQAAKAAYCRIARRFLTGAGMCEGDGRIRAGSFVQLSELGPLFDGKYYVTEARHLFDQRTGYRTQFRVERPFINR